MKFTKVCAGHTGALAAWKAELAFDRPSLRTQIVCFIFRNVDPQDEDAGKPAITPKAYSS